MPDGHLRVIDLGSAGPLRSQTLWHALARCLSPGAPPVLSFVRPTHPYVSIGYHRRLDEVDLEGLSRQGVPVYRRMVGGGPVYLDSGQLFFQICVPASSVPAQRDRALRFLLEPAVSAFRAAGVGARLDERGEIVVGDRKVCGHGAGQVEDAVVVVGNLIESFDHTAAAGVLSVPSPEARIVLLRLMRRYVAATPCDTKVFREAAELAYAAALGLEPRRGGLHAEELSAAAELDAQFEDPGWLSGPDRPARNAWQAKVRAGVSAFEARDGDSRLVGALVGGRLDGVSVFDAELNGSSAAVERSLGGLPIGEAPCVLDRFGEPGRRLAKALSKIDGRLV